MYNIILADLFKLRKSKPIKILFGITTISAIAMVVIAYLIPQGKVDASMTGIGFMFSDVNMLSILGSAIAGIYICGDFDNKTINHAITNGCSRSTVIVGKSITFFIGIVLILIPYLVAVIIACSTGYKFNMGSVSLGFLNLLTQEAGTAFSASEIWRLLLILLSLVVVYLAQLSICVPFAFIFKKPVLVVVVYYGFSILCGQLAGLKDKFLVFDKIFSLTPYGGNYSLLTRSTASGDVMKAVFVSLIFMIIMFGVTHLGFRKAEIK